MMQAPINRLVLAAALSCLAVVAVHGATVTWTGTNSTLWSDADNWGGTALDANPGTNALTFNSPPGSNQPSDNDLSNLIVTSITFNNSTSSSGVAVGGNAFTLSGASSTTLNNQNVASGRNVTIGNNITVSGAQTWQTANDVDAVTILNGSLSGTDNIVISANQSNNTNLPALRLGGTNSGYTGTITHSSTTSGLLLASPQAMTGGLINIASNDKNLWLTGNTAGNPYTFQTGDTAGSPNVNFRNAGTAGLYLTGGDVYWNPTTAANDYTWAAGTNGHIRLNGSNDSTPRMLYFGNSSGDLILTGNRSLSGGGGGSNPGRVTVLYALADDAIGGQAFTSSTNLAILTRPAVNNGATASTVAVSSGVLAVGNMNYIFNGNLNLSGGAFLLDNVSWGDFTTDRSGGYGSGANQWQLSGTGSPGFAARAAGLTIDATQTTATTFDRNFTLGSNARATDGSLYANAAVVLDRGTGNDTISLSAGTDRTVTVLGKNTEADAKWLLDSPVHELAGKIAGGASGRTLTIKGAGPTGVGGILRLGNASNDFIANLTVGGTNGGGIVLVAKGGDGAFGNAANTVTLLGAGSGQDALLLFEGTGVGTTFAKNVTVNHADNSANQSGIGSYAGQVTYTGTMTRTDNNAVGMLVYTNSGSTMNLGATGTPAGIAYAGTQTGSHNIRKGGAGELVLANLAYTPGAASSLYWQLHEGTLTTTANDQLASSGAGSINVSAILDATNASDSTDRTWHVASNQSYNTFLGTTKFADNVKVQVDDGLALNMAMGINVLVDAEKFGATNGLTFGLVKTGTGTWNLTSNSTGISNSTGRSNSRVRVDEGVFDCNAAMGRSGLLVNGGTLLVGDNIYSPFVNTTLGNRVGITSAGGKIGISVTATGNVTRPSGGIFVDGDPTAVNNGWDQSGVSTVTFAARDNYNLVFAGTTFPDVAAGTTLLVERDGAGTGVVQINDTALAINGSLGGSGELKLGTTGSGTLTVYGTLAPGSSPGTLTLDANLMLAGTAELAFELGVPWLYDGSNYPSPNDLVVVDGDLVLDGVLSVFDAGGLTAGTYTLFTYTGSLTDNGLLAMSFPERFFGSVEVDALNQAVNLVVGEIPEPAGLALLGLGAVAALGRRRRG